MKGWRFCGMVGNEDERGRLLSGYGGGSGSGCDPAQCAAVSQAPSEIRPADGGGQGGRLRTRGGAGGPGGAVGGGRQPCRGLFGRGPGTSGGGGLRPDPGDGLHPAPGGGGGDQKR